MVYNEEMADAQIVSAIAAAAQRGAQVRILLTGNVQMGDRRHAGLRERPQYSQLAAAGVTIRPVCRWPGPHVHPRQGPARRCRGESAIAFAGSQNIRGICSTSIASWGFSRGRGRHGAVYRDLQQRLVDRGSCAVAGAGPESTPAAPGAPLPIYNPLFPPTRRCLRDRSRAGGAGTPRSPVTCKARAVRERGLGPNRRRRQQPLPCGRGAVVVVVGVLVAGADVDGLVGMTYCVDGVLRFKSQVEAGGSTKVGSCLICPVALSPLPTTKLPATTVQLGALLRDPFMATIEF